MEKLTAKQVIAYSKADQKNIQTVKAYTFASTNRARLIGLSATPQLKEDEK